MKTKLFYLFLVSCIFNSCSDSKLIHPSLDLDTPLQVDYFSGQAEICTYEVSKARYNNNHPGEAVLVYVTEQFDAEKQVKSDNPQPKVSYTVLKLNYLLRFSTGIYDYSMFTSVFTPAYLDEINYPVKITNSSQDWCGQSFMQVNQKEDYHIQLRSYFESEGDLDSRMAKIYSEDNFLTMVRIAPESLPIGDVEVLPSLNYLRTAHIEAKPYAASATMEKNENEWVYSYEIPALKRSVKLCIDPLSNYRITSWTENYPTVFDGEMRTTTYTLKAVTVSKYWEKNNPEDTTLRDSLKIGF